MKKILASISILALLALAFPAESADTATVTATVTAKNISVTVDTANVSYGTLNVGTESSPLPISGITVTNNGNVTENFDIKGSNSTNWTLDDVVAGANTFMHKYATDDDSYTAYTGLHNTNYKTLATSVVATSGTQLFKLKFTMPSSTATYAQQSTTVTVLATAS